MRTYLMFLPALAIFVILDPVSSTPVNPCTNNNAPVPEVEIKDCSSLPCTFYINSTGVMAMKFKAPRYLENIAPRASADALGVSNIPYPLPQSNACEGITNTPCPLAEDELVEYIFEMTILPIFPQISLTFQFSLVDLDSNEEPFECFRADLVLKQSS